MKKDIDLTEYEEVPKLAVAYTEGLIRTWEKLGKPTDASTNVGWIMIDTIIAVWHKAYPHEVEDWKHDHSIDIAYERTLQQHVKGGGYNPVTYPPRLYQMMKTMLPNLNFTNKKFIRQLCARHPLFKTTSLNI